MPSTKIPAITLFARAIEERSLAAGGFPEHPNGSYRPDSTAWAVLALAKLNPQHPLLDPARARLKAQQSPDGRLSYSDAPSVFWPTPLAVLAWNGTERYKEERNRAVLFLLAVKGIHPAKTAGSPVAHDTSLNGWQWTEGTHSFIEPSCMALMALEAEGHTQHPRFQEGVRMVMDRQLPHGGWNYGNTLVYGKELRPFIDTTGMALVAVSGHVREEKVAKSLLLLREQVGRCRSPLSLCWALIGLGSWGEFPSMAMDRIVECLERQERFGPYATSILSLLLLTSLCDGSLKKDFQRKAGL
jgi:hypothetical protein